MASWRDLHRTTAFRWTLTIASGFAVMALVLFGFIYWQTAVVQRQRIDLLLAGEVSHLSALPPTERGAALEAWIAADLHAVRYAGLFSADGGHIAGNLHAPADDLPADGKVHRAVFVGIDRDHDGDDPEVVRAVSWHGGDGGLVTLGYDIDELEDIQALVVRALILGLVPALILSLTAGVTLAQRRIAALHEAIGRIVQGRLTERLPLRGSGDDMDRLVSAVNGMLSEIECLVTEIQGVGDNIAHDLRTPLTRVRARLERGRDEATTQDAFRTCIDRAISWVDQALSVVSAVLRISEIEHGRRRSGFIRIDLQQIAQEAFELYEPMADERGLELQLDAAFAAPIVGDSDLLLEAISNLLENALKYAPANSAIVLAVLQEIEDVKLSVTDRGSGIAIADRERVLQRFYRADRSRTLSGSGLGLSLVATIVGLHGFRLRIDDAGPGCVVTIFCGPTGILLPAAASAPPARTDRVSAELAEKV